MRQRNMLSYCTICQKTWEFSTMEKREIKHQGMPSYGLKREQCSSCKELTKSFKKYMGPELHIKNTPDLQFIFDESRVYSEKIEKVLKSITSKKENDR